MKGLRAGSLLLYISKPFSPLRGTKVHRQIVHIICMMRITLIRPIHIWSFALASILAFVLTRKIFIDFGQTVFFSV